MTDEERRERKRIYQARYRAKHIEQVRQKSREAARLKREKLRQEREQAVAVETPDRVIHPVPYEHQPHYAIIIAQTRSDTAQAIVEFRPYEDTGKQFLVKIKRPEQDLIMRIFGTREQCIKFLLRHHIRFLRFYRCDWSYNDE